MISSICFLTYEAIQSKKNGNGTWGWLVDSFTIKEKSSEQPLLGFAKPAKRRLMKTRLFMMLLFGVLDLVVYWFFIKSYQLAHFSHLNQGILMSIFSLLPILMSISFFFFFHQHLKKIEIIGIFLSVGGVLVIAFSKDSPEFASQAEFVHPIWSILAMLASLIFIVIRYTIFKYEMQRVPDSINNASVLRSLVTMITGIPLLIIAIIYWSFVSFSLKFLLIGGLAGIICNIANNFGLLATVMSKGGPATAVIETAMIFQTICDFMFLGQKPNFMEIIGLMVGFLSTIVIVIGEKILHRFGFCLNEPEDEFDDMDYEEMVEGK